MGGKTASAIRLLSRANVIRAEFTTGYEDRTVFFRTEVIFSKIFFLKLSQ
jgi:hypothetical protein